MWCSSLNFSHLVQVRAPPPAWAAASQAACACPCRLQLPAEYVISDLEIAHMAELQDQRLQRKAAAKRRRSNSPAARGVTPGAMSAPAATVQPALNHTGLDAGQHQAGVLLEAGAGAQGGMEPMGGAGAAWSNAGGEGSSEAEEGPLHVEVDDPDPTHCLPHSMRGHAVSAEALAGVAAQAATNAAALHAASAAGDAAQAGNVPPNNPPAAASPSLSQRPLAWLARPSPASGLPALGPSVTTALRSGSPPVPSQSEASGPHFMPVGSHLVCPASSSGHRAMSRPASTGAMDGHAHPLPPLPPESAMVAAGVRAPGGPVPRAAGGLQPVQGTANAYGTAMPAQSGGAPIAGRWSADQTSAAALYASQQHAAIATWGASAVAAVAAAGSPGTAPVLASRGSGSAAGGCAQPQLLRTVTSVEPLRPLSVVVGAAAGPSRPGSTTAFTDGGRTPAQPTGSAPGTNSNSPSTPKHSLTSCIALVAPGSTPDTPAAVVDPTVRSTSVSPQSRDGGAALARRLATDRLQGAARCSKSPSGSPAVRGSAGSRSSDGRPTPSRAARDFEALTQHTPMTAAAMAAALAAEGAGGGSSGEGDTGASLYGFRSGGQAGHGQGLLQFLPCSQSYSRLLQDSLDLPSADQLQQLQDSAAAAASMAAGTLPLPAMAPPLREHQTAGHAWYHGDGGTAEASDAAAVAVATAAAAAAVAAAGLHNGARNGRSLHGSLHSTAHDMLGDSDAFAHALAAMAEGHAMDEQQRHWAEADDVSDMGGEDTGPEVHSGHGMPAQLQSPGPHRFAMQGSGVERREYASPLRGELVASLYKDQHTQQQQGYAAAGPATQAPRPTALTASRFGLLQAQQQGYSPGGMTMHQPAPPPYDFSGSLVPSASARISLPGLLSSPASPAGLSSSPVNVTGRAALSSMGSVGCMSSHHRGPTTGQVVVPISQPRGVGTGGTPVRSALLSSNSKHDAGAVEQAGLQQQ